MTDACPITRFQIYGERCSGTNFLESLLRENLPGISGAWDFGWKHFFHEGAVETADDCLFIAIYRDPLVWLRSLHRKPAHVARELKSLSFSRFIRRPWWCIWDDNADVHEGDPRYLTEMLHERDPATGERFANVMRMRSAKIRDWESLRGKVRHFISLRYEDLYADPEGFISRLADRFGLERASAFHAIETHKGRGKAAFVPKTYAPLQRQDLDHIRRELDADQERLVGYDLDALIAAEAQRTAEAGSPLQRWLRPLVRVAR